MIWIRCYLSDGYHLRRDMKINQIFGGTLSRIVGNAIPSTCSMLLTG